MQTIRICPQHFHLDGRVKKTYGEIAKNICLSKMTVSQKIVTPVKTAVQSFINYPNPLDSGFRRNDEMLEFLTFCEIIKNQ
jgi:hypothetical protein